MKWHSWLCVILAFIAGACAGWAWEWYTSPLARPLCMGLSPDYLNFWLRVAVIYGAGIGAAALIVIGLMVAILVKIRG